MTGRQHDFEVLFGNIEMKTGVTAPQIIGAAIVAGKVKGEVKATDFYIWANTEFGLGRGYAQALWINFEELAKANYC